MSEVPPRDTRPGALAWAGAALLWVGAAVMSFDGLDGLAESCRITPGIAMLLPLVIDLGVGVAAWVWRRGINEAATRLAGRLTWSLLGLTIVGNAAHLGMEAAQAVPPWWAAALVGAIPPAVAGATAHLLVLLGRSPAGCPDVTGTRPEHSGTPPVVEADPTPPPAPSPAEPGPDGEVKRAAAAERSRRARDRKQRHNDGDHSICLPKNCPFTSAATTNGHAVRETV